jgi:hypothetical protein
MDAVYVNKDGENPELRYSLRTLKHVTHHQVWIFGGAPVWINPETVQHVRRLQKGSPYRSTRAHIAAACGTPEVSDPFMLWNDDFFAMQEVGEMPLLNRGPIAEVMEQYANVKTLWARGLRDTALMLRERDLESISYDLHVPLIVHKEQMREAIRWADKARCDAVQARTLYGNLVPLGGTPITDVKMSRRSAPFPEGPWLSSSDDTFRSVVEPVLRYLFPEKCNYERGSENG